MNAEPTAVPFEALLEHQEFVRALARKLVRDEHDADDLEQETWRTALAKPPRDERSVRGWLTTVLRSRAHNQVRERSRRDAREALAARPEADASDEAVRERVALAQRLVTAVLQLEDPYRSVILLRFYEDLDPAAIATRRGVPAGTVRSQLARGLERLRERLDREYGERRAWSTLLLPMIGARPSAPGIAASTLGWVAAAAAVAIVSVPLFWSSLASSGSGETRIARPADSAGAEGQPLLVAAAPSERAQADAGAVHEAPVPAQASESAALEIDLSSRSLQEVIDIAQRAQDLNRARILERDDDWPEAYANLHEDPRWGSAWLVPSGRYHFEPFNPVGVRGGGAYYSFANRSHDYDAGPDVWLSSDGSFRTGLLGEGFVLDLGDTPLDRVPASSSEVLEGWSETRKQAWLALWTEARNAPVDFSLRSSATAAGLGNEAKARHGHTYVVRSAPRGRPDVLVAFTSVTEQIGAHRILFRILDARPLVQEAELEILEDETYGLDGLGYTQGTTHIGVGSPGRARADLGWMNELDLAQTLELQRAARQEAERRLLAVSPEAASRFALLAGGRDSGLVRLLERGRFGRVVASMEGGAFFSFATESHGYDREPDLALEQGRLDSGFCGNGEGLMLDVGAVELDEVVRGGRIAPATWSAQRIDAWDFLWTVRHRPQAREVAADSLEGEQRARADELGLLAQPEVVVGHTYLVRSTLCDEHDLLVAFQIAERDANGVTLAWHELASWPVDKPR